MTIFRDEFDTRMINYGSVSQKNDKIYGINDLKNLNKKMDSLLKNNHAQSKGTLSNRKDRYKEFNAKVFTVLDEYDLQDLFKNGDFEELNFLDESKDRLVVEDRICINERIIELLANKIIQEKENRLQTEIQMNKIRRQNQKQIKALETMLKSVSKAQ